MEMLTAAHGVRNLASLLKTKLNETPHDAPRSRGWRKFGGLSHTSCATWPCKERRSVAARHPYEQGWHFFVQGWESGAMGRTKRGAGIKTIHGWKQARVLLERWQKSLQTVQVELNQPRAIDPLPIDLTTGEPAERKGKPQQRFQGQLIYFTSADVTIRRPSGAILVIDNYEIVAISDGKGASNWFST